MQHRKSQFLRVFNPISEYILKKMFGWFQFQSIFQKVPIQGTFYRLINGITMFRGGDRTSWIMSGSDRTGRISLTL
jgi:hypothetical protein